MCVLSPASLFYVYVVFSLTPCGFMVFLSLLFCPLSTPFIFTTFTLWANNSRMEEMSSNPKTFI
jgi:hypothetical protein